MYVIKVSAIDQESASAHADHEFNARMQEALRELKAKFKRQLTAILLMSQAATAITKVRVSRSTLTFDCSG